MEPMIWGTVLLDGVITVVDAEWLPSCADDEADLARQITGGDLVVLNKTDLVDPAGLAAARDRVLQAKPGIEILEADHCRLPIEVLLGVERNDRDGSGPASSDGHHHDHGLAFETWTYTSPKPLRLGLLQQLLQNLPPALLRAKGFVYAADKPHRRILLQLVGRRATLAVKGSWTEKPPQTQLVFIARSGTCDFDAIEAALDRCVENAGFHPPPALRSTEREELTREGRGDEGKENHDRGGYSSNSKNQKQLDKEEKKMANRHPNPHSDNKGPHAVEENDHRTLIKNISIFNGTSEDLIKGKDVVLLITPSRRSSRQAVRRMPMGMSSMARVDFFHRA